MDLLSWWPAPGRVGAAVSLILLGVVSFALMKARGIV
jgi:hypothetical protein